MRTWTTEMWLAGMPDEILVMLTDPRAIARWAPVEFELLELEGERLQAGSRARVRGALAGRPLDFTVDVRYAHHDRLALIATGPISISAEYLVREAGGGSRVRACVTVAGRGVIGSVLAHAVEGLLAAGLLRASVASLARELEAQRLCSAAMVKRSTPAPPPALHELESEIMEEAWRQGETTVKLVMEALNRKAKPPRAYTTYMTVMRRLADKGLLERTREGRRDAYVPVLTRDQYRQKRADAEVRGLVDEFGDVALAHFAKSLSSLDPARRRQLRRLADEQ